MNSDDRSPADDLPGDDEQPTAERADEELGATRELPTENIQADSGAPRDDRSRGESRATSTEDPAPSAEDDRTTVPFDRPAMSAAGSAPVTIPAPATVPAPDAVPAPTAPQAATAAFPAPLAGRRPRRRVRLAGLVWGLILCASSAAIFAAVASPDRRDALQHWYWQLSSASATAMTALAIGIVVLVIVVLSALGNTSRRR